MAIIKKKCGAGGKVEDRQPRKFRSKLYSGMTAEEARTALAAFIGKTSTRWGETVMCSTHKCEVKLDHAVMCCELEDYEVVWNYIK
jgi:hypothetical protein